MAATPQASIVVPTLNEVENIGRLISDVFASAGESGITIEMIVVDDGSTDGTREAVLEMGDKFPIKLISRPKKMGISSAVLDGFRECSAGVIGVMDSDLSHPPERVPDLVRPIVEGNYDMTIGSRYVEGGSTPNWPRRRRMISRTASALARPLTDARDPMSGFFFLRNDLLESVEISTKGWKICLEILVRARPGRVKEVPITFTDRTAGSSKMGMDTVAGFLINLLDLYSCQIFRSLRNK